MSGESFVLNYTSIFILWNRIRITFQLSFTTALIKNCEQLNQTSLKGFTVTSTYAIWHNKSTLAGDANTFPPKGGGLEMRRMKYPTSVALHTSQFCLCTFLQVCHHFPTACETLQHGNRVSGREVPGPQHLL